MAFDLFLTNPKFNGGAPLWLVRFLLDCRRRSPLKISVLSLPLSSGRTSATCTVVASGRGPISPAMRTFDTSGSIGVTQRAPHL